MSDLDLINWNRIDLTPTSVSVVKNGEAVQPNVRRRNKLIRLGQELTHAPEEEKTAIKTKISRILSKL